MQAGYRIMARTHKGLATQHAPHSQRAAGQRAVDLNGLGGILGAGGNKAAGSGQHGRKPTLIKTQRELNKSIQHSVLSTQLFIRRLRSKAAPPLALGSRGTALTKSSPFSFPLVTLGSD